MPSYGRGSMLDFIQGDGVPITPEMEEEERRRRRRLELGLDPEPEPTPFEDSSTDLETRLARMPEGALPDERLDLMTPEERKNYSYYLKRTMEWPNLGKPTPRVQMGPRANPVLSAPSSPRGPSMTGIDFYDRPVREKRRVQIEDALAYESDPGRQAGSMLDFIGGALPEAEKLLNVQDRGEGRRFELDDPSKDPLAFLPPTFGPLASPAIKGPVGLALRLGAGFLGDPIDAGARMGARQALGLSARMAGEDVLRGAGNAARRLGEVQLGLADDLNMTPNVIRRKRAAEEIQRRSRQRDEMPEEDPFKELYGPELAANDDYASRYYSGRGTGGSQTPGELPRDVANRLEMLLGRSLSSGPLSREEVDRINDVMEPLLMESTPDSIARYFGQSRTGPTPPKLRPQDKPYAAAWDKETPEARAPIADETGLASSKRIVTKKWLEMSPEEQDRVRDTMKAKTQAVVDKNNKALALEAERAAAGLPPTEAPPIATPRTRRARAQAQAAAQTTDPIEPQSPDDALAQAAWNHPDQSIRTQLIDDPALYDTPWESLPEANRIMVRAKVKELRDHVARMSDDIEPSAAKLKALEESGDVPPIEVPPVAEPPRRGRIDGEPIEAARPSTVTTPNQKIAQLWQNILSMPEDQLKAEMFQVRERRALDNLKGARALREGEIRELRAAINNEYAVRRPEAEKANVDPNVVGREEAAVNRAAQAITGDTPAPRQRRPPRDVPVDADYAKVPVRPTTAEPTAAKVAPVDNNDEWVQGLDKFFDDAYAKGIDPKSKAAKNIQVVLRSNGVSATDARKMTWEQAHEHLRSIKRADVETPSVETPPIAAADGAGGKPPRPPRKTTTAAPEPDEPQAIREAREALEESTRLRKEAEAQGEAGLPSKGDEPIDLPKSEYIEYSDKPAWGATPLSTLKKLFPDLNIKSNTSGARVRIEIRDKKGTLLQLKTIGRGQKGRMAEATQELMELLEKENGLKALITPETKMQRVSKPEPAPERLLKKKVDPAHPYNRMSQEELSDLMAERNIPERKTGRMSWTQRRDALEAYDANKAAGKTTDEIAAKGPDTSTPKTEEEVEKILEADIKATTGLDPEDVRQLPNMNAQKGKVHMENRYKDSDLSFRIQRTPGGHWKASAYKGKGKAQTLEKQGWGTSTVNEAIYDLESKLARTDNVGESAREYAVRNNIPEVITRLAATLRSTTLTSLKEGQDITRTAAKAGRFAEAAKSLKGKTGLDAYFGSLKYLKGELPTVQLDKLLLTKNESDLLSEYIKLRAVPTVDEALGDVLYSTYANANRALVKLLSGKLITTKETSYLTDFFGPDIKKAIESHDPAWKKTMRWVYEASNLPRFVVAAGDLSWPLRQGFPLIRNKEFWKGNADMLRAFLGPRVGGYKDMSEYADDVQAALEAHPKFNIGHNLGLYLSQGDSDTDEFVKAALSRSWLLGRTNEAFRGVDNNVRWNMFYKMADELEKAGVDLKTGKDQYQMIVDYLNFATGRGKLPDMQKLNQVLSTVFFAPRFFVSRPELAWQTGKILRPGSKAHALIKKQVALDIGTSYGMLTALLGITAIYHGQNPESEISVETDPRSSDFAKLRVGTARVDLSGGYQPLFRFLAQASTGEVKSVGSGEVNETDSFETFERFLRSKLNIIPSQFLDNFKYGATFQGKELVTPGDRFEHLYRSTILPMTANQIFEIMINSGLSNLWLVPIAELGGNTLDFTSDDERIPGYHEYRTADSVAADLVSQTLFKTYKEQHEMAMSLVRMAKRANGEIKPDPKDQIKHMEAETLFNRLVHRIREGAKNNNPELVSYLIATQKARKWEPSFTDKDEEKAPPPPRYIKPPEEIDGPWTAPFANQVLTELMEKEWGLISPNGDKRLAYNQLQNLYPEAKSSLDTFRAKLDEKTFEMSKGEFDSWAKLESNADRRKVWKAIPAPQLAEKSPEKKLKEKGTQLFKERPTDKLKIKESVDRVNPRFFDSFSGGVLKGAYDYFGR